MAIDRRLGHLKLQDLRVLTLAAEAGSMAKAAAALGISQPSVSYAIANLERVLGVPLFDRGPQGVSVTDYGRALIERGTVALNEMQYAVNAIGTLADPRQGQVRLGTTPPMSAIASQVIARLTRRHPRMTFHLMNDNTTALLRLLRQREIEIAISRIVPPFDEPDIADQKLFEDQLAVIASRSSPWLSRPRIKLADLTAERWVLPPETAFLGSLIHQIFRVHGIEPPRPTVTTTSTYATALMVANGPFLTIQPATMLKASQRYGLLAALPVDLKAARHPVALLALKDRALSAAAQLFLKVAREG